MKTRRPRGGGSDAEDRGGEAPCVIVADDDPIIRKVAGNALRKHGMRVETAATCAELERAINPGVDAVLLDLWMPDRNGIECLRRLRANGFEGPVIMITGERKAEHAVEAMKAGAYHYLLKPLDLDEIYLVTRQAVDAYCTIRENARLTEAVRAAPIERQWVGVSAAARECLELAQRMAASDATVLITGETGTGKSLMARMIHEMSGRGESPFITVSCAALPRELIDSELFGHEKGAYTGAIRERPGRMELARNGTLFLDEIGDLPLSLQPKVLRALQEREYERVGGDATRRLAARVITATHQSLEDQCKQREFREDLYYRIAVLRLHLPALRDRMEDLPALADLILEGARHVPTDRPMSLGDDAVEALKAYDWPGNVRELQNVLERAATLAEGPVIHADDLRFSPAVPVTDPADSSAGRSLADIEREAIENTLAACNGNMTAAARTLGVTPKTVQRKLRAYAESDTY